MKPIISLFSILFFISLQAMSQGLISKSLHSTVTCGSYDFMESMDRQSKGYLDLSNQYLQNLKSIVEENSLKRAQNEVLRVPVVFHVVSNQPDENLDDSVLLNQIEVLNANFNREISDTVNLRSEFSSLVSAANIEFYLAQKDPEGNVTNGITRTQTPITNFGGVLTFKSTQQAEIQKWINDSLMYNLFRITQDSLGGKTAWNSNEYFNIWIGNLTILETEYNNFEELVFLGLSTPPNDHSSWPSSVVGELNLRADGTLMHYLTIGSNNPNLFEGAYSVYNGVTNTGKMLVHEAGHYLGLRHIWGDGNCSMDDYIDDTPKASNSSLYNCKENKNSCLDTINGGDLPDMIENYMDYSGASCQNSFTTGQVAIMRAVLDEQRNDLVINSVNDDLFGQEIKWYPNPTKGVINLEFKSVLKSVEISVFDIQGKLVNRINSNQSSRLTLAINGGLGIYFIRVIANDKTAVFKVVKN